MRAPLATMAVRQPFGPNHNGVDLVAALGTPVYAAQDGTVVHAGEDLHYPGNGLCVEMGGADGLDAFLHLCAMAVHEGQAIIAGDLLGWTGCSGFVVPPGPGGAHLHWSRMKGGVYIDPVA